MKNIWIYIFALTLMTACADKESSDIKSVEQSAESQAIDGYEAIEIELIDQTVKIQVPGEKLSGHKAKIQTNNTGATSLQIGSNFSLEFTEQNTDIASIVKDLGNDIFYKNHIIDKTNDMIIYERGLPDGSDKHVHFCKVIKGGDVSLTIKTPKNGQFKKSHVDRMIKSANTINITKTFIAEKK